MGHAKSLRKLGDSIGLSKSQVTRLSKEWWFPQRGPQGYDIDEVLRAIRINHPGRKDLDGPQAPDPLARDSGPPGAAPPAPAPDLSQLAKLSTRVEKEEILDEPGVSERYLVVEATTARKLSRPEAQDLAADLARAYFAQRPDPAGFVEARLKVPGGRVYVASAVADDTGRRLANVFNEPEYLKTE